MRISGNTESFQEPVAGPSKRTKRAKHRDGASTAPSAMPKRKRSYQQRTAEQAAVNQAQKKAEKQKKTQEIKQGATRSGKPIFAHVYVGNLESTITEKKLRDHFRGCGAIRRTTLRVSRGQAINVGVAIPASARTTRDRKYATVEFDHYTSTIPALKLNGSELDGSRIVVAAAAGDLPEVADIARPHLHNIQVRNQQANLKARSPGAARTPKPLVRSDTVQDFSDPNADKHRVMGYSFVKCVQ
ncbi:hypothetical protein HYPSUDRAFT_251267 [Hypholoma sublateritium FD-334 SS-4]|uniref:RRM domain-containing protein n=1 Tax=Hypholoma sublateritium (strain FD-334 SS-4) TaxID=945553 RepID=A0A0D2N0T4_HYPSF|nr:hypothetical protein HYPSUDRAFT_251267 [Hypholoma sublateritium FD-334 SS-4]